MSRLSVGGGLGVAVALQFLVLVGMLAKAAMPLWTGSEIHVETVPVDPRSMFRGNYARLNYDIGSLPHDVRIDASRLHTGVVVYVVLRERENGLHEYAGAFLEQPEEGIFLRGRITNDYSPYRVKYGIEAFFAPKQKALKLESELRGGGVAILMVTRSGSVALKDVVPNVAEQ